jgi:hypothetical protein
MGFFDNLFGKISYQTKDTEHAVIIKFNYNIPGLQPLHELEKRLEKTIKDYGVGEYDGHEIAVDYSDGFLYMYGSNAEILFKTIKPVLDETDFMQSAIANLRFGPPADGVREIEINL